MVDVVAMFIIVRAADERAYAITLTGTGMTQDLFDAHRAIVNNYTHRFPGAARIAFLSKWRWR